MSLRGLYVGVRDRTWISHMQGKLPIHCAISNSLEKPSPMRLIQMRPIALIWKKPPNTRLSSLKTRQNLEGRRPNLDFQLNTNCCSIYLCNIQKCYLGITFGEAGYTILGIEMSVACAQPLGPLLVQHQKI